MELSLAQAQAGLAGRYRVERVLGNGATAVVFLARDAAERAVAVKILRPEVALAAPGERFLREMDILRRLDHPHILPMLDSGGAGSLVYYVLSYAPDGSLRDRLNARRTLAVDEAVRIARDVASALDHAHAMDVVHRDIKPENILFDGTRALVCDFGVARAIALAGGTRISTSGIALGTPLYMSPEQAEADHAVDGRTDVYALACVLYEALTGDPPFTGGTIQSVLARHVHERPPSLRVVRPDVPDHVERAVLKALAKRPEERPASGGALVALLDG